MFRIIITLLFLKLNKNLKYDPTLEESFEKVIELEGKSYRLKIWDTAGTV